MDHEKTAAMIDEVAADWVARIQSGAATVADQASLTRWLAQSRRHEGAYVRAQAIWLAASPPPAADAAPERHGADVRSASLIGRRAALAGLVAAGAGAANFVLAHRAKPDRRAIRTDIGEMRRIPLDEGIVAVLNTRSEIQVWIEKGTCCVELVAGEVLFLLDEGPSKPLFATAAGYALHALNSAFALDLFAGEMSVLVATGTVSLEDDAASYRRDLRSGDTADMRGTTLEIRHLGASEVNRRLAWRDGIIILDGETVATAVDTFNRYNRLQIRVSSEALGNNQLFGRFSLSDPEGFATAVSTAFGASARKLPDENILLLTGGKK